MLPRTRPQAILLFGGLCLLAFVMHVTFCRWAWQETVGIVGAANHVRMPLLTYTHQVLSVRPVVSGGTAVNTPTGWSMSGLFARHSPESAKGLGIAMPIGLLGAALYLFLVWRHEDRHRKGQCSACGHQLKRDVDRKRCPECGEFAD